MSDTDEKLDALKAQILSLKNKLFLKEKELQTLERDKSSEKCSKYSPHLTTNDVSRYSRQMLVPSFGTTGQIALQTANVLIVGAGGLGCPCALYLATAGVGNITIVDNDDVELSNLHRQVLHSESDAGRPKVKSAYDTLHSLNSNINITPIHMHANSSTIANLFQSNKYDVVIDGSDNVATRYLLNDACVLNKVPLVSGSALQMEGQLTVYNYKGGPCYRCIFPVPPPPETVTSCGDGGVLGPVPGTIGLLQALEVIKILSSQEGVLSGRLMTFDGSDTTFRNIKLRNRNVNCSVCGEFPSVTSLIDYEQFCGAKADDKNSHHNSIVEPYLLLEDCYNLVVIPFSHMFFGGCYLYIPYFNMARSKRVTDLLQIHNISILSIDEQIQVSELLPASERLLIDVRPNLEYKMCHLPDSINVPYSDIQKEKGINIIRDIISETACKEVLVICRRGNDSQRAISKLKEALSDCSVTFKNVRANDISIFPTQGPSIIINDSSSWDDETIRDCIADLTIVRPGLYFEKATRELIKFRFKPYELSEYVCKETTYSCTLYYTGDYWLVRRSTLPVSCMMAICNLFTDVNERITDSRVWESIGHIYETLMDFLDEMEKWRKDKYQRYLQGDSEVIFDDIDETIFLSPAEIAERHRKLSVILKRMIPPETHEHEGMVLRPR